MHWSWRIGCSRSRAWVVVAITAFVWTGCSSATGGDGAVAVDGAAPDASARCIDPTADEDGDGISNGDEGCLTGRDTDGDAIPDWKDLDSDADGLGDADEDRNGDGVLGCCLVTCNAPKGRQASDCKLNKDGCGPGQVCKGGSCSPAPGFLCSDGETDPYLKDTFGDGVTDGKRGTFICRDATEDDPGGRKAIKLRKSPKGDWHVALEPGASYTELAVSGAGSKEHAAAIDLSASNSEVAGFVLSLDTTRTSLEADLAAVQQAIVAAPPGGGAITQRSSGTRVRSHDRYEAVQGLVLDVTLPGTSSVSAVRNELLAALLGKPASALGNLPPSFGASRTAFVIRLVTVRRVKFKQDSTGKPVLDKDGNPVDSGDSSAWRLHVMGAVASKKDELDAGRATGINTDDLSNGTALARSKDIVSDACDVGAITRLPLADVIWVMDESGSMNDNRQDVVDNAKDFFGRAQKSGLDFRMGVTGMCDPAGVSKAATGKFCSKISSTYNDMGGQDRFLLPSELSIFESCVNNPPGFSGTEWGLKNVFAAVKKHLPRAANRTDRIRPGAKLEVIVVTDDMPKSLDKMLSTVLVCILPPADQKTIDTALSQYLQLLTGQADPEAAASFHVIGGVCPNPCPQTSLVAHGYRDLAHRLGGVVVDVCQKNLGDSLQEIIDAIIGASSPIVLEHVPISASLAVTLDGIALKRSRTSGVDYRAAYNTLALIGVAYSKGSHVVASYKRWRAPEVVQ